MHVITESAFGDKERDPTRFYKTNISEIECCLTAEYIKRNKADLLFYLLK